MTRTIRYTIISMKAAVAGMKAAVRDMSEQAELNSLPPVLRIPEQFRDVPGITHSGYADRL